MKGFLFFFTGFCLFCSLSFSNSLEKTFEGLESSNLPLPAYIVGIKSADDIDTFLNKVNSVVEDSVIFDKLNKIRSLVDKYESIEKDRPIYILSWIGKIKVTPVYSVIYLPVKNSKKALSASSNDAEDVSAHGKDYIKVVLGNKGDSIDDSLQKSAEKLEFPSDFADLGLIFVKIKASQNMRDTLNSFLQLGMMLAPQKIGKNIKNDDLKKKGLESIYSLIEGLKKYISGTDELTLGLSSSDSEDSKDLNISSNLKLLEGSELKKSHDSKKGNLPLIDGLAYDKESPIYFSSSISDQTGFIELYKKLVDFSKNSQKALKGRDNKFDMNILLDMYSKVSKEIFPGIFSGTSGFEGKAVKGNNVWKIDTDNVKEKYDNILDIYEEYFNKLSGEGKVYKSFTINKAVREYKGKSIDNIIIELDVKKISGDKSDNEELVNNLSKSTMELTHDDKFIYMNMGEGQIDKLIDEVISKDELPDLLKAKEGTNLVSKIDVISLAQKFGANKNFSKDVFDSFKGKDTSIYVRSGSHSGEMNLDFSFPLVLINIVNKKIKKFKKVRKKKNLEEK